MSEQDDSKREFDIRWADNAELKEPSARARMLAARWKENPPEAVPFRGEPEGARPRRSSWIRSSWISTAVVLGCVAGIILLLGYVQFRAPYQP
ncbi:hypothetical protein ACH4TV_01830 [Streptomyces sp. NPDC020898]|uniref:SCO2583/SCO2584 N-terminal domain-containing protein n=1 Tax=Streptomyces sp. NPDC020898 TaxID=3365101 RepID=UPI0037AC0184